MRRTIRQALFTSDKKSAERQLERIHREGLLHLSAALFLAVFGAIYEHFAHGVFSYYMIYAFLIPLAPGAALYLWMSAAVKKKLEKEEKAAVTFSNADSNTGRDSSSTELSCPDGAVQDFDPDALRYTAEGIRRPDGTLDTGPDAAAARRSEGGRRGSSRHDAGLFCLPGSFSLMAWDYGIAVLAVGSIFKGVLEIYGTTNQLAVVYPIAGTALLCAGLISFLAPLLTVKRMRRKYVYSI